MGTYGSWVRVGGYMSNRSCKRNKRTMYYSLYSDKIPILDEDGNDTYEYKQGYDKPVKFQASLSAGKGSADDTVVGVESFHTREISTSDMNLPIVETSLIWANKEPKYNDDESVDVSSAEYKVIAPPLDGLRTLKFLVESINGKEN